MSELDEMIAKREETISQVDDMLARTDESKLAEEESPEEKKSEEKTPEFGEEVPDELKTLKPGDKVIAVTGRRTEEATFLNFYADGRSKGYNRATIQLPDRSTRRFFWLNPRSARRIELPKEQAPEESKKSTEEKPETKSSESEKPKEFPYQKLVKELEKIGEGKSVIVWLNTDVPEEKANEIQEQVDCSPVFMETKSYAEEGEFQLTFPAARIESKKKGKFPQEQILEKIKELKSESWPENQYIYLNISEEDFNHAEQPESTIDAQLETIGEQLRKIGLDLGVILPVPYLKQGQVEIHLPPTKTSKEKETPKTSAEEPPKKPETPEAAPLENVPDSKESPESEKKISIPALIRELEELPAGIVFVYLNSEDLSAVRKEEKKIKDAVMCYPTFRRKSSLPRGQFEIVAGDIKNTEDESKQPEPSLMPDPEEKTKGLLPPLEQVEQEQAPAPSEPKEEQPEAPPATERVETEKDKFIKKLIQEIQVFPKNHAFIVHLNPEDADAIQDEINKIKKAVEGKPIFIPADDLPRGEIRIPAKRQQKKEGTPLSEAESEKPEKEKSLEEKLAEKRKEYLEAKRLRGKFTGKGKYKGKEKGLEALSKIGEEYNELRSKCIQEKVGKELEGQNLESEELNKTIVEKLLKEYGKEDERVEKMITEREKGRWQKFKEWWRKHPKTRMAIGFSLAGASIASIPIAPWLTPTLIGLRAGFSGVGTTIGTEGRLAKHSKKLGEKGLVNKFAELTPEQKKEVKKIKGRKNKAEKKQELFAKNTEERLKDYTPEKFASEIAPELARLRTLRERKGKKLEEVGPYGGVIAALQAKESELLKQEALKAMEDGEQEKEALIAKALSESLDRQTREMDRSVELAGEKERKKALKRWLVSGAAGALATAGTVWWGLRRYHNIKAKTGMTAPKETAPVVPAEISPEDFRITAQKGDSVWTMAKKAVENSETYGENFKSLNQAQKTYVIDAIKDQVAKNPKGFGLTDVDIMKPGQEINLSEFFNKEGVVEEFLGKAGKLSKEQIENILSNNEIIQEFQKNNPGVRMTSDKIESILSRGGRRALEETAQSSVETAAPELARGAGEETVSGLGSEAGQEAGHSLAEQGIQASTGKEAAETALKETAQGTKEGTAESAASGGTEAAKEAVGKTAKGTIEAGVDTATDVAKRIAQIENPAYPRSSLMDDFLETIKDKTSNPLEEIRKICKGFENVDESTFQISAKEGGKITEYTTARFADLENLTQPTPTEQIEQAVIEKLNTIITGRIQ